MGLIFKITSSLQLKGERVQTWYSDVFNHVFIHLAHCRSNVILLERPIKHGKACKKLTIYEPYLLDHLYCGCHIFKLQLLMN